MFRTPWARLRAPNTHPLGTARRAVRQVVSWGMAVLILFTPAAAHADPGTTILAANSLPQVVSNLQMWVMGILGSVATLFAVIGFTYRVTAGGDPAQVDKGNAAFRNALLGYGGAVLAPVLLQIVKGIVGG